MQLRKLTTPLLVAVLLTLSAVASAATFNKPTYQPGQNKDSLSGKYEGVAKSDQIGDIPLTVEIKNDNGKLTGKIETPQGPAAITGGTFDNGKIVMKFDAGGNEGTVTAMLEGDKISGKWELAGQGGAESGHGAHDDNPEGRAEGPRNRCQTEVGSHPQAHDDPRPANRVTLVPRDRRSGGSRVPAAGLAFGTGFPIS